MDVHILMDPVKLEGIFEERGHISCPARLTVLRKRRHPLSDLFLAMGPDQLITTSTQNRMFEQKRQ